MISQELRRGMQGGFIKAGTLQGKVEAEKAEAALLAHFASSSGSAPPVTNAGPHVIRRFASDGSITTAGTLSPAQTALGKRGPARLSMGSLLTCESASAPVSNKSPRSRIS